MTARIVATYTAECMADASPRHQAVVTFTVTAACVDNQYVVVARRDDCGGIFEYHCSKPSSLVLALHGVMRRACGHGTRYWLPSVWCEVDRAIMEQLRPLLPR